MIKHQQILIIIAAVMSNIYEGFDLPQFWIDHNEAMIATFHKCYWHVIDEYSPFFGGHVLRGMGRRMEKVFKGELFTQPSSRS